MTAFSLTKGRFLSAATLFVVIRRADSLFAWVSNGLRQNASSQPTLKGNKTPKTFRH